MGLMSLELRRLEGNYPRDASIPSISFCWWSCHSMVVFLISSKWRLIFGFINHQSLELFFVSGSHSFLFLAFWWIYLLFCHFIFFYLLVSHCFFFRLRVPPSVSAYLSFSFFLFLLCSFACCFTLTLSLFHSAPTSVPPLSSVSLSHSLSLSPSHPNPSFSTAHPSFLSLHHSFSTFHLVFFSSFHSPSSPPLLLFLLKYSLSWVSFPFLPVFPTSPLISVSASVFYPILSIFHFLIFPSIIHSSCIKVQDWRSVGHLIPHNKHTLIPCMVSMLDEDVVFHRSCISVTRSEGLVLAWLNLCWRLVLDNWFRNRFVFVGKMYVFVHPSRWCNK